jgi:hypothetical protein
MPHFDRTVGIAAVVVGAAALSGCHAPPPAAIASFPVNPTSQYSAAQTADLPGDPAVAATTAAPYAPPPKRAEIPPPAPSPHSLWQAGHWSWDGAKYVWARGHYLERPTPTANWLPGYWQEQAGGWVWVAGHWRS